MGIILDGVRDHIIPHILGKDATCQMWVALIDLYQITSKNKKMVLQEKLNNIRMNRYEIVTSYLKTIQQAHDEILTIGEAVNDSKIVKVAPKGRAKHWTTFVDGILARQQLPDWNWLWDDFIQKEI